MSIFIPVGFLYIPDSSALLSPGRRFALYIIPNLTLLEWCVGGFTQNNTESSNQLIWKISPKHLSGTSVIVEIAAYVAASVFNEGSLALLTFMQHMGISSASSAHDWARSTDSIRISRHCRKLNNILNKAGFVVDRSKKMLKYIMDDSNILNVPGIDDSVRGKPIKFAYDRFIPDFLVFKTLKRFPRNSPFSKSVPLITSKLLHRFFWNFKHYFCT